MAGEEKTRIGIESFKNAALAIIDLYLIEKIKPQAKELFQIEGMENLEKALAGKKGAVMATSHLGSWEFLSFLPYLAQVQCSVIVKVVKNKYINEEINRLRRVTLLNPILKTSPIREIFTRLQKNEIIAILIDQWAGPAGLWTKFFHDETSTTSFPARMALKRGASIYYACCLRQDDGTYRLKVLPPVEVTESDTEMTVTEKLNRQLEEMVRKYPGQWMWGHRRWKPKPKVVRESQ